MRPDRYEFCHDPRVIGGLARNFDAQVGVFIYASHEAANRDWAQWRTLGMLANTRVKQDG
jgi:hypothetical protein